MSIQASHRDPLNPLLVRPASRRLTLALGLLALFAAATAAVAGQSTQASPTAPNIKIAQADAGPAPAAAPRKVRIIQIWTAPADQAAR